MQDPLPPRCTSLLMQGGVCVGGGRPKSTAFSFLAAQLGKKEQGPLLPHCASFAGRGGATKGSFVFSSSCPAKEESTGTFVSVLLKA